MTRTCLFSLLQLVAFAAVWLRLFRSRLEAPALYVFVALAALLGVGAVSLVWTLLVRGIERRAIARAAAGLPLEDRRFGAAVGKLVASGGQTLSAPLSGRPALAYEYDIFRWRRTGSSRSRDQEFAYYGYGLSRCAIHTPTAIVRLLGMPQMDDVPSQELSGGEARRRSTAFVASSAFEQAKRGAVRDAFRAAMARINDDTEEVRRDVRIGEPPPDLSGWTLAERVLAPGEDLCVVGRFAAEREGLVPPPAGSGLSLRVLRGDPATVARRLRIRMIATGVLGAIGLAALHGALLFAASRWEDRSGPEGRTFANRQQKFAWAVQEGRIDIIERLIRKGGIDPNHPGTFGDLPVHEAKDAATLDTLLDLGANAEARDASGFTSLMLAANAGDTAKLRVLIRRHVDLEAESPGGFTALQLASAAAPRRLLSEAGARDRDLELAAGEPLPPDGGEPWRVASAYLQAIGSGDEAAYRALHARGARGTAVTAEALRDARPHTGRFLVGRLRGDRVVLEAEGPMAGGVYSVIVYLVREDGTWRVLSSGLRQPDFDPPMMVPPAELPAP